MILSVLIFTPLGTWIQMKYVVEDIKDEEKGSWEFVTNRFYMPDAEATQK